MAEFAIGTQYDIAQRAFESGALKPMTQVKTLQEMANVGAWLATNPDFKYFMLMCREAYDFTIFNMVTTNYYAAQEEIREVLESRGDIVWVEFDHMTECYEFWVKCNDEMKATVGANYAMFRLFDCNAWVVEV